MTDQEIEEAVARKLGWEEGPGDQWRRHVFDMPKHGLPDYCHSIEAAWEIVEKIPTFVIAKLSSGWAANPCPPGFDFLVKADTAPMAICLAFLKLEDS